MTKEQFKERMQDVIDDRYQKQIAQMNGIIDSWDGTIEKYDNNYFLPQALYEAMFKYNNDHVDSNHYSYEYVRKYKKAVREMQKLLFDL